MPERLVIAYGLIAVIVIAVTLAVVLYGRRRRAKPDQRRGNTRVDL